MEIRSPLTNSLNVTKESNISVMQVAENYRTLFGIDVSKYLKGLENIDIYKCLDSGYKFYYPFSTAGDSDFYEQLQKYPWYYMDWKWEHQQALNILRDAKNLLEIGCGRGEFIEKAQKKEINCIGLELNKDAVEEGAKKGIKILNESIEEYSKKHRNEFDVVCTFQVLEHIANVREFIMGAITALKPGGKLIICVPNNDSIVYKTGEDSCLNMPPHHMGLWNMNSLIKLQHFFPISLLDIYLEPLQSYHTNIVKSLIKKRFNKKLSRKHLSWVPFLKKLGGRIINMSVENIKENIVGHSILVIYSKT